MRQWRARWVQILNLKRLENVHWMEETSTIMMDNEHYFAHTKVG
jgi:hypothetical protein